MATSAGTPGVMVGVGTILIIMVVGTPAGIILTIMVDTTVGIQAIGQQPVATWDNVQLPSTEGVAADQAMVAQVLLARQRHQV